MVVDVVCHGGGESSDGARINTNASYHNESSLVCDAWKKEQSLLLKIRESKTIIVQLGQDSG